MIYRRFWTLELPDYAALFLNGALYHETAVVLINDGFQAVEIFLKFFVVQLSRRTRLACRAVIDQLGGGRGTFSMCRVKIKWVCKAPYEKSNYSLEASRIYLTYFFDLLLFYFPNFWPSTTSCNSVSSSGGKFGTKQILCFSMERVHDFW